MKGFSWFSKREIQGVLVMQNELSRGGLGNGEAEKKMSFSDHFKKHG